MASCSLTPEEISKLYEEAEDEVEEAIGDIHFSEKQMIVLENCGKEHQDYSKSFASWPIAREYFNAAMTYRKDFEARLNRDALGRVQSPAPGTPSTLLVTSLDLLSIVYIKPRKGLCTKASKASILRNTCC